MPTRVQTIVAVFLCTFLCLFGGAAHAKQTVLFLSTAKQTSGNTPINDDNASNHFSQSTYGNANLQKYDGVLSSNDDTEIQKYKDAFENLKPGDAVVVITGNNQVQNPSPNPTITDKNINALKEALQNPFYDLAQGKKNAPHTVLFIS